MMKKRLAAVVLLLSLMGLPQVLGLSAHILGHHGKAGHQAEWAGVGASLAHGHQHSKGDPEHEHRLLPSHSIRHEPPQDLVAPIAIGTEAPDAGLASLAGRRVWEQGPRLSGSSPPRLQLLCTLLI